jgi:hypothetical protein
MEHDQRRAQRAKAMKELDKDRSVERPTEYASAEAGREALERGLEQWREEIIEPEGEVNEGPILERYIQEGAGWSWQKSYKNRKFAWCGCFAAWCWISVLPKLRKKSFPSTYRLREWARGTPREIKGLENARAGDIMVIATSTGKRWGDHITIIDKIEEDLSGAWTVEGNAFGETPSENRAEGVVRCFRPIEKIKFIYRPLEVDLIE